MKVISKKTVNILSIWVLGLGILFASIRAYPATWLLAERTINHCCVMNFGDSHAPLGTVPWDAPCLPGMKSYPVGAIHLNEVLKRWIAQLSHDSVPTLFLLEWAQDGFVPAIYEEDTIPMLKKLFSQCAGKVEFRCADYRTTAIKSFGPEFWYPFSNEISANFEGKWRIFCSKKYKQIMTEYYGSNAFKMLDNISATQFLREIVVSLRKIEVALENIKEGRQNVILSQYHRKISEAHTALESFFRKYLESLDMPYYLAFVNSVSLTHAPAEIREMYKRYMFPITMNIADAGFLIDVVSAVSSGKYARVVTYTGLAHMTELEKNLFESYGIVPNWLGLTIPPEAQSYYEKAGTRVLIGEMCSPSPENPEFYLGNIAPESLCLKLGMEWSGVSAPQPTPHTTLQKSVEGTSVAPQQAIQQSHSCKFCGKEGASFRCSRCQQVFYCSPTCQRADWKGHKQKCVPPNQ